MWDTEEEFTNTSQARRAGFWKAKAHLELVLARDQGQQEELLLLC